MSGCRSKRRHVWATTGRPATSRNNLSMPGPIRVPLPAATMMAVFIEKRRGLGAAPQGADSQSRIYFLSDLFGSTFLTSFASTFEASILVESGGAVAASVLATDSLRSLSPPVNVV